MKNMFFGLLGFIAILFGIAYFLDRVDTRSVWYLDNDGDGFGDIQHSKKSDSIIQGYVDNSMDCHDNSAHIAPNNTTWHATPYTTQAGELSFDFDCNGIAESEHTQPGDCQHAGWLQGIIPPCGETGLWQTQCQGQHIDTIIKVQRCR